MVNHGTLTSGSSLSQEEYEELIRQRDEIDRRIGEYENECRRGTVKVMHGTRKEKDVFSLRIDSFLGKRDHARWRTIISAGSVLEMAEIIDVLSEDLSRVRDAFREKNREE